MAWQARLRAAGEIPDAEGLAVGFLSTRSWAEARRFCHYHPEVLSEDVDRALAELEPQLDREGDTAMLARVRDARSLLGACRRDGLELGSPMLSLNRHSGSSPQPV